MLSYLIYTSNHDNISHEEVESILDKARENNSNVGVTGMLICSDTHFVQYLEGERENVSLIYDKIRQDNRHNNIQLVKCEDIRKNKLFRHWSMVRLEDNDKTRKILNEYQGAFDNFSKLPSDDILDLFIKISVLYVLEHKEQ